MGLGESENGVRIVKIEIRSDDRAVVNTDKT
jgi:hypothetical protein